MTPESKKRIDRYNAKVFKKYGTDNAGEMRHICTECGERCSIDNSISRRGHELICKKCECEKTTVNSEFFAEYFSPKTHPACTICEANFDKWAEWGE
jgi:hypothetical protein